jgi:predicted permease
MLLAGFTVAKYDFKPMLVNAKVYVATFLRLVVIPAAIIVAIFGIKTLANLWFDLNINNFVLYLSFFAVGAPLGLNTVVFPEAFGGDPKTGASMAMISHTICVLTIPLMYALLSSIFPL